MDFIFGSSVSIGLAVTWVVLALLVIFYWRRYAMLAATKQLGNVDWPFNETALDEALAHRQTLSTITHRTTGDALDILQAQLIVEDASLAKSTHE